MVERGFQYQHSAAAVFRLGNGFSGDSAGKKTPQSVAGGHPPETISKGPRK